MRSKIYGCSLTLILATATLHAQSIKKVMILDFKNLDKNPDYTYLEDSITEAVRNDLKAKFDFREMQRGDWHCLAHNAFALLPFCCNWTIISI